MSKFSNKRFSEISKLKDIRKKNKIDSCPVISDKLNIVIEEWSSLRESIGRNSDIKSPLNEKLSKKFSSLNEGKNQARCGQSILFRGALSPSNSSFKRVIEEDVIEKFSAFRKGLGSPKSEWEMKKIAEEKGKSSAEKASEIYKTLFSVTKSLKKQKSLQELQMFS